MVLHGNISECLDWINSWSRINSTLKNEQANQAGLEELPTKTRCADRTGDPEVLECWFQQAHPASDLAKQLIRTAL